MPTTPEQQLRFLSRNVVDILAPVLAGFIPDPGTSDLYDEQPIWVSMTLGDYRRASRLSYEVKRMDDKAVDLGSAPPKETK